MTYTELKQIVAKKAGLSIVKTDDAIKALAETLKTVDNVNIQGFGTFKRVLRKARVGRNPRTNETINIPEKRAFVFKPSK